MKRDILVLIGCIIGYYFLITLNFGCANIGMPTGGARDSLPPRLLKASPELNTLNFKGNKITLTFNEYVEVQDLQSNLFISPLQKNTPAIGFNLKTVSIKLKDTLLPNTTYSINFGNAIRDVHESNILRDFTYVFSTGNTIDSLTLEGRIIMSETGTVDSTIIAMLYRNLADSAVLKIKPDYITRLDGNGNFKFNNLPGADFKLYALKDGDGGKTYNSKTEAFAFSDSVIHISGNNTPVLLYAYTEQKTDNSKTTVLKAPFEKKLRYSTTLADGPAGKIQDLLDPLILSFNNPLKRFDSTKAILVDTNYKPLNYSLALDSTHNKLSVKTAWRPESFYVFIIPKDAVEDSAGNFLSKSDTIRILTKRMEDYGRVVLRFSNLDLSLHPVIQLLEGENLKFSYPITGLEWSNKQFPPGEYSVRILFDTNNNGVWDPGNFSKKIQPEKAITLTQKLGIKADWDNERDIKL